MKVRLAVMSDLHCHPSGTRPQESFLLSDALRSPAGQHPVASLLQLIKAEGLQADALLAPGDLSDKVNQQGMVSGWAFIEEVAQALQVTKVVSTLGNHDVDSRRTHGDDAFDIPRRLAPERYPVRGEAEIADYWTNGFCIVDGADFRIAIINSVAQHHSAEMAARGSVSETLVEDLSRRLSRLTRQPFQVAMVHHHPVPQEIPGYRDQDLMVGGTDMLDVLGRHGYTLVVHGHKHFPRLRYYEVEGVKMVVFGSGSFSAMNANMTDTRNLFHIVELDNAAHDGCHGTGRVFSWRYGNGKGWRPSSYDSAEIPHVLGFGCHLTPDELVSRSLATLQTDGRIIVPWGDLLQHVPQLDYVTAGAYLSYARSLRSHGFDLSPAAPERATYVARIS